MMDTATLTTDNMRTARKAMIDSQLRTSGVNADFVLARMNAVPREDFVPESARGIAYMDRAVPLGEGRYLGAPLVQGMMLETADPQPADRALVVDGGSGYFAELLRPLVAELTVITPEDALAKSHKGDGFDLLVVDGAIEQLPASLVKRLKDHARIVSGVVSEGVTSLAQGRKIGDSSRLVPELEIGIPRLPEFDKPKGWTF